MVRATVVIAAAGSGERLGRPEPKAFVEIGGEPILVHAVRAAIASGVVDRLIVVSPSDEVDRARGLAPDALVVAGGPTRHASISAALGAVAHGEGIVVCHDAARPFASPGLFRSVVEAVERWDAAVPAIAVTDTIKRVDGDRVVATEPRDGLVAAQTPQAFRASVLEESHRRAGARRRTFTDDAACVEWAGYSVTVVAGEPANFKITDAADLERAEIVLAERARG